ncbi:MAG: histidine kinase [Bacteroidales bacterium]|nr:histidine kinase [Bacteroidales bacterium]
MRNLSTTWIIHIFAILHAVVALSCRLAGIEDELLLTILTMTMALIVCTKSGLNVDLTAAAIIVMNIFGYFIGNLGADILQTFMSQPYAIHALSTLATTEILGWSIVALTSLFNLRRKSNNKSSDISYLSWLILAMCGIFVLRLSIVVFFSGGSIIEGDVYETSAMVFSNSFSLITLICINVLYVRYARRYSQKWSKTSSLLVFLAFTVTAAFFESILAGAGIPIRLSNVFNEGFPLLYATSLLAQIAVYCVVYIINYALSIRSQMKEEREKANMAQYRYVKLKHQVNPHFLFNSLNILDCLICDNNTEAASAYTHKLAGIYRYMLKSEDEMVVSLRDELVFVELYTDLLKERFPVGFHVETSVPEELMARFVLPCSIQLLIENATKHNAVSEEEPLVIRIEAEGESIRVTNNRIPKVSKSPSTGLGQAYIKQMYRDLSGKEVKIEETDKIYQVTLPLI